MLRRKFIRARVQVSVDADVLCCGAKGEKDAAAAKKPAIFRRIALKTTTDEQMKAHGHQDRAYENNVRPTRHRVGCLDESPFP